MAAYQSHITFATATALAYGLAGLLAFDINPEHVLLASVIVVLAGMLPDIDASNGPPAKEMGGLLAVVSPLIVLEFFPAIKSGGITRIALVVICCYLFTRIVIVRGLGKFTVHRGMIHSVPAAIITFELCYLLFWDLFLYDRLYIASAALVGFLSHLLLDAYSNVDILGKAMGNKSSAQPALKLAGNTWMSTLSAYSCIVVLGWFILKDFYPQLTLFAGVQY